MVPLPNQWQRWFAFITIEFIRCYYTRDQAFAGWQTQCIWYFTIITQYRPAILPYYGCQIGYTPYCTIITEQISIPVTFRCVDNSPLCNASVLQCHLPFPWT